MDAAIENLSKCESSDALRFISAKYSELVFGA